MPRLTLFKKILITTLLLSMAPLVISSLILFSNLETTNTRLAAEIADTSDKQAAESLQMRAKHVAETVSDLLRQCENDLLFLARITPDRQTLLNFYLTRRGEIWERRGAPGSTAESRELIPLYNSIALIDRHGRERLVIRDGRTVPEHELRNVSDPSQTEFLHEDYFSHIRKLEPGQIHVTHLTGYHITRRQQLAQATEPEDAYNGERYRGVVRFGTPLRSSDGSFDGMVVISLDHRHLMEFTQHIDPGRGFSTVFPSYKSGNYAFMFDDEGWIITHPKFWDIRGLDRSGKLVPPYTEKSTPAEIEAGLIPFNLDYAGFIHPNYPRVAHDVRHKQSGSVDITNVGRSKKIMAYAPIMYDTGDFKKHGIFGGVTIGFQVDQFHDAARKGSRLINRQLGEHRARSIVILVMTSLLAGIAAWRLSRGIGQPLERLTEGTRMLAEGNTGSRVPVTSTDEVGELARTFNIMADELEARKNSLLATLDELRGSRQEILDERNFKESILESISSAIVTISPVGLLTSINGTGIRFLGDKAVIGSFYRDIFSGWGDIPERIERALSDRNGYGRQPLRIEQGGDMAWYDIGVFPIGVNAERGLTITMRNETEREKLRDEMIRLDRLASLGKLSAGIAHEVRNPLTGISLLLDDLHDNAVGNPDDRIMIKKALTEIERVERLVTSLLNYASPVRVDFRDCDLNMVAHDIFLLMRRQAEKQKISLTILPGELPVFRFDPEKIKQAMLNIVRNAIEALGSGGEIVLATWQHEGHAVISIRDNGPGISEDDLPLVFEPFFTRKGAGTGLGLSITQRIIDEHNGRIRVESQAGQGTNFIVELPIGTA